MKRQVSIRRLKKLGRKMFRFFFFHLNVGRAARETWIGSSALHGLIAAPRPFPVAPVNLFYGQPQPCRCRNGHLVAMTLSTVHACVLLLLLLL